jgi:formylglycine-generating enzyme required for sulfatase activity
MIRLLLLASAGWLAIAAGGVEQAAQCDTPLTEAALKEMISGGVGAARLRSLIASCGLDVRQPDQPATEARLKAIGLPASTLTALAPPAAATTGATWTSPIDRRAMVLRPAGTFQMGSEAGDSGRDADETAHQATIARPFWIDVDEVTNEAYQQFVISRPEWQKSFIKRDLHDGNYLKDWQGTSYPDGRGSWPVAFVSWHAARAYAAWAGKRLPTEAEWEYAARAGATTRFWWGSDFDASHVITDPKAPPAAERRTNAWGVRDATGSVWEWTSSLFRPYPYAPGDGREDVSGPAARSTRGGSRANGQNFLRLANRSMEDPTYTSDLLGFRCVR